MLQLLRSSPTLIGIVAFVVIAAFVCGALVLMMRRAGQSLRPIMWFAGFLALVGVPQIVYHVWSTVLLHRAEKPRMAALDVLAQPYPDIDARAAEIKTLFGADTNPALVQDVRQTFGDALAKADVARLAMYPSGETALIARLPGASAATDAWVNWLRVSGLNEGGEGDSERGYTVTRPAGDRVHAAPIGSLLGVWSAADDETIRRRMVAGGFRPHRKAHLAGTTTGDAPEIALPISGTTMALAMPFYLLIVVAYFFKGASWASGKPAAINAQPVSAAELTSRIESINALDVPFRIERGAEPGELFATWRYADAKWVDLARAHGMRRMHRIRLVLDESAHVVRATDYSASHDWSAGADGARIEWKAATGIVFFQREHQRVFGLQLDESGRLKPELSYAYTFDLAEMKQPLIQAVTRAGWTWRPVAWQGPRWLRWLTE